MEVASQDMQAIAPMLSIVFFIVIAFVSLISSAITVLIWCKLFGKSGYSWGLGFLILVPVANIIVPFYLAFSDWPVLKKLREYEQQQ